MTFTDGRRGSNVYEVNLWLWSFARDNTGKPRLGGLSVEQQLENTLLNAANRYQETVLLIAVS